MTVSLRGIACRVFVAALIMGAMARPADAGWVTFNYNYLAAGASGNNASVQTYMNSVLTSNATGMTVTVAGADATNTYSGDNHVVGPTVNGVVKPLTLATTDGGDPTAASLHGSTTDSYIATLNSTKIDMTFAGGKIYGISFDYEIFPNVNCASAATCTEVPDFTFKANGSTIMTALGVTPGQAGVPYNESPLTIGNSSKELALQLGPKSFSYTFANGVNSLSFVDWPVVIGVDNLRINTTVPVTPVPEPASMVLLGSGLAAAYAKRRRDQRKASATVA